MLSYPGFHKLQVDLGPWVRMVTICFIVLCLNRQFKVFDAKSLVDLKTIRIIWYSDSSYGIQSDLGRPDNIFGHTRRKTRIPSRKCSTMMFKTIIVTWQIYISLPPVFQQQTSCCPNRPINITSGNFRVLARLSVAGCNYLTILGYLEILGYKNT